MQGFWLKGYIEERAIKTAEYIIETKATVRQTARKFGVSKSTVHKDVTSRLARINPSLASEARKVLDINKQERHIRGGLATKEKYLHEHNLHTSKNIWFFNNIDSHYISHKFICLYMVVFLYNSS